MVATIFKRALAAASLCATALVAQPALANSSAANAADITAPVPASPAGVTQGDAQFRELFSSWEAMDGSADGAPAPTTKAAINIPSRMPLGNAKLTSDYGMRNHPVIGGRRRHNGVDLAAPTGTPIYATADGVVSRANRFSSYGLYISIEHGGSIQTRFAHLSRLAVRNGDRVEKGDIIGYVGSTGRSTGPHLHYEVRVGGKAVNPIPYMVETEAQEAYALAMGEGGRGGR